MAPISEARSRSTVLVTGAAGFVGNAIRRRLEEGRCNVIAVDAVKRPGTTDVQLVDLRNQAEVRDLLGASAPQAIVHCAAFGSGDAGLLSSAENDPLQAVHVNLLAFANLLQEARSASIRRVVWASSTTVYGPHACYGQDVRVDENDPTAPTSSYGATKVLAERICAAMFAPGSFEPVALRLPLVYGPGRWYGGAQRGWLNLAHAALRNESGHFELEEAPADWIFISDATLALERALAIGDGLQPTYNVSGVVTSEAAMGRIVVEQTGAPIEIVPRAGQSRLPLIDGRSFEQAADYRPAVQAQDGIRAFLSYLAESTEA